MSSGTSKKNKRSNLWKNVATWAFLMKFHAWSERHNFMPFKFLRDEHPRVHVKWQCITSTCVSWDTIPFFSTIRQWQSRNALKLGHIPVTGLQINVLYVQRLGKQQVVINAIRPVTFTDRRWDRQLGNFGSTVPWGQSSHREREERNWIVVNYL
jgi:hypothetical protein